MAETIEKLSGAARRVPTPPPPRAALHRRARRECFEARLALDDATRDDAFALRHASYSASGHIAARPDRRFSDRFDALPNARTLVVYQDGRPVGSVRACLLGRDPRTGRHADAPCRESFPELVDRLLRAAAGPEAESAATADALTVDAIEVNRLVRSPAASDDRALVFLLYRVAGWFAVRHDAPLALSCVRQNHIPFYRRLRFREVGPARAYPGLSCPMHLMACPRADYDRARAAVPIMDPEAFGPDAFDGLLEGRPIPLRLRP